MAVLWRTVEVRQLRGNGGWQFRQRFVAIHVDAPEELDEALLVAIKRLDLEDHSVLAMRLAAGAMQLPVGTLTRLAAVQHSVARD